MGFFSINKEVFPIGICLRGLIKGTGSDSKLNLLLIINKLIIKVIKAKKGLDTLYYIKGLLVINSLNLLKINFNSIYAYNKSKVFYTFYSKFIFLNINL